MPPKPPTTLPTSNLPVVNVNSLKNPPKNSTVTTPDPNLENHLVLPITIFVENERLDTYALLDSGASTSFINSSLVRKNQIPTVNKSVPRYLEVIDGRPISSGPVIKQTLPLVLSIYDHQEIIPFDVVSLGHYPVILGVSWLKLHNPSISWPEHKLRFLSCATGVTCHQVQSSVDTPATTPQPNLPGRHDPLHAASIICNQDVIDHVYQSEQIPGPDVVPQCYSAFLKLFSSDEANKLPGHRSYDHAIELEPGAVANFGPIYSLSEIELTTLREYLAENTSKGFIRPSTSSAGAPILFVKKRTAPFGSLSITGR